DAGQTVTVAGDGDQALAALTPGRFDAAVLDVNMPHMNGLVAMMRMAEVDPGLSMIILTGESAIHTAREAILKVGAFDLVAHALHRLSKRAAGPFVKINCAAIPRDLVESELFGYERGAFSGAVQAKKGRLELADGGTLFLDEIGDLSLEAQAKLLRVIESGAYGRVGGTRTLRCDRRIGAAP